MKTKHLSLILLGSLASLIIRADLALFLGIILSLFFQNIPKEKIIAAAKTTLGYSVIGLGFGMNIHQVLTAGTMGLAYSIGTIIITMMIGCMLGRQCNIPFPVYYLLSTGTAICGGSAIAAISKSIQAKSEDISLSLFCVFVLNALAILLFPCIGSYLELSPYAFGLWAAIAIHDTSSVLIAASSFSEESLIYAIPIKLTRALCIVPLALFSSWITHTQTNKKANQFPWFILFFVLATMVTTFIPQGKNIWDLLYILSKKGLSISIFLIGISFSIKKFARNGSHTFMYALSLWLLVSALSAAIIVYTV